MSRYEGRRLSPEEAAIWARLAQTVVPLDRRAARKAPEASPEAPGKGPTGPDKPAPPPGKAARAKGTAAPPPVSPPPPPPVPVRSLADPARHGLDSSWNRKLARGAVQPDFTLDLHGASLDAAHGRLMHGLAQAKAMGARVVLLVAGKSRPADPADRTSRRGAIRAKVVDWLAASEHARDIAAIRNAHPRHGGHGALYIVLRRRRG